MSDPIISILMPVKNGMPWLKPCLDSICKQTFTEWELLVVNDHSIDETWEMLQEYAQKDARIVPLQNRFQGISAALELAYCHSRGTWITRMDADDLMPENKLKQLLETLIEDPSSLAVPLVQYFSETELGEGYTKYEQWLNNLTSSSKNYTDIYKECVIPSPAWMVSRELVDRHQLLHQLEYPEDYDFCFRTFQAGVSIKTVHEVLHLWRDHPGRTSRNSELYDIRKFGPFKMKWWLKLEYNSSKQLILWGAGKKGKELATFLHQSNVSFRWVSDNIKKQGHMIAGSTVEVPRKELLLQPVQVLVAVSAPQEQKSIQNFLEKMGLVKGQDFFHFY